MLDELPTATAPLVLLVVLIRTISLPEAGCRHASSTLPPVALLGPCRPRTLVPSLSHQTPGPSVLRLLCGSQMVLQVSSPMSPTPHEAAEAGCVTPLGR